MEQELGLIYIMTSKDKDLSGFTGVGECLLDENVSFSVPANSPLLQKLAKQDYAKANGDKPVTHIIHACINTSIDRGKIRTCSLSKIKSILKNTGFPESTEHPGWFSCNTKIMKAALENAFLGFDSLSAMDIVRLYDTGIMEKSNVSPIKKPVKAKKKTSTAGHPAADALDWSEAMSLINKLNADGRQRDALLVACGCFLGLRISDILTLRWSDILNESLSKKEKKTGKTRQIRVNPKLRSFASQISKVQGIEDTSSYVFGSYFSAGEKPLTRQRADQILKEAKQRYGITSAKVMSTHTLRKTFGRRVWQQECKKGRGEQALLLLCDVFGHSSVAITKRYLGIRQEEILSVYDNLL